MAEAKKSARAMWKAAIEFEGVRVPVKLYAGVVDRSVHFRLLHAKDGVPVQQRLVDVGSGAEVAYEDARRGIAVESGVYVVLSAAELSTLAPQPSRSIEITRFVPRSAIDYAWYSRPYWLGPDGDGSDYAVLAAAMAAKERCGIARWAMRGSSYFGALESRDGALALTTLRSAEEVVAASHLAGDDSAPVRPAERKLADQLVAELAGEFDPSELRDAYREKLQAFVKAKAAGKKYKIEREVIPLERDDLAAALKQSLQKAKTRRAAA
jgi:DNA end-binding protein Ku